MVDDDVSHSLINERQKPPQIPSLLMEEVAAVLYFLELALNDIWFCLLWDRNFYYVGKINADETQLELCDKKAANLILMKIKT